MDNELFAVSADEVDEEVLVSGGEVGDEGMEVVPDDHVLVRHSPALAALHPAPARVITVQPKVRMMISKVNKNMISYVSN